MPYEIHKITDVAQLNEIIPLFDDYRQFYRQTSDIPAVKNFLTNLFNSDASVIFAAYAKKKAIGFTQRSLRDARLS